MTKKELLEAIKDMPEDAEIEFYVFRWQTGHLKIHRAFLSEEDKRITLC